MITTTIDQFGEGCLGGGIGAEDLEVNQRAYSFWEASALMAPSPFLRGVKTLPGDHSFTLQLP